MPTLQELLAQREALEKQISSTQNAERSEALAKVKALMAEYNLDVADLQKSARIGRKEGDDIGPGASSSARSRRKPTCHQRRPSSISKCSRPRSINRKT